MAKNVVLEGKAEEAMQYARALSEITGQTRHVYNEVSYAARSWKRESRVILKAEVVYGEGKEPKDNGDASHPGEAPSARATCPKA